MEGSLEAVNSASWFPGNKQTSRSRTG